MPYAKPASFSLLVAIPLVLMLPPQRAHAELIYSIGNSLTWDTRMDLFDGPMAYHIACSRNLQHIFDHPSDRCIGGPWNDALANTQYDWLTVQPYNGTTLQQDVDVISNWMQMQPNANIVVHTGWSRHTTHERDYHAGNPHDTMVHSPEYFSDLMTELNAHNPGRTIVSTRAMDVLDSIYHDIEDGTAPFTDISDLYRDEFHMNIDGRYLMHNLMRIALGQPIREQGFSTPPETRAYLNSKMVASTPEPSSAALLVVGLGIISCSAMARRRKALQEPPSLLEEGVTGR